MAIGIFKAGRLNEVASNARTLANEQLWRCVAQQKDTVEIVISPEAQGFGNFLEAERGLFESKMRSEIMSVTMSVFSAAVCFSIVLSLGLALVFAKIAPSTYVCFGLLVAMAFLVLAIRPSVRAITEVGKLSIQGFVSGAEEAACNQGRSLWAIGQKGICVAKGGGRRDTPSTVDYLRYDALQTPRLTEGTCETAITLTSITGKLERVMIFYGQAGNSAASAARLLGEKIQ